MTKEWTTVDLAVLDELEGRGLPVQDIADRMERSTAEIEDHLPIVRERKGRLATPA